MAVCIQVKRHAAFQYARQIRKMLATCVNRMASITCLQLIHPCFIEKHRRIAFKMSDRRFHNKTRVNNHAKEHFFFGKTLNV